MGEQATEQRASSDAGRARRLANILPHRYPKGVSGNPKGRPVHKRLTNALAALIDEDPIFYTLPVNTQVVAIAWFKNMKKIKGGAFLKEALTRLEGHVPKVVLTELPAMDITFHETPRVVDAAPVAVAAEAVVGSPGTEAEGTTLPGSTPAESRIESQEPQATELVPVRTPPEGEPFAEFKRHAKEHGELEPREPDDFNLMDLEEDDDDDDDSHETADAGDDE